MTVPHPQWPEPTPIYDQLRASIRVRPEDVAGLEPVTLEGPPDPDDPDQTVVWRGQAHGCVARSTGAGPDETVYVYPVDTDERIGCRLVLADGAVIGEATKPRPAAEHVPRTGRR